MTGESDVRYIGDPDFHDGSILRVESTAGITTVSVLGQSGKLFTVSEFKAKCLGLIEQVRKTRQPLRITRHGRPVAEIIPAGPGRKRKFLGNMIGTAEIVGDIESPIIDLSEIEAYRD